MVMLGMAGTGERKSADADARDRTQSCRVANLLFVEIIPLNNPVFLMYCRSSPDGQDFLRGFAKELIPSWPLHQQNRVNLVKPHENVTGDKLFPGFARHCLIY
jgi:hypothetical protein